MKIILNRLRFSILFLLAILSSTLIVTCEKDVDPIKLKSGITVSSSVLNSETNAVIPSADVLINGVVVMQTDAEGNFTLDNLADGSYIIQIIKNGFSEGYYTLEIKDYQGILPVFYLKALNPPVTVTPNGGAVPAYYSTGKLAAELVIPANSFQTEKKISSTVLFGTEVPAPVVASNKIQGTVIDFEADDKNLTFANGADLTFTLPFKHRPGELLEITLFNKSTLVWDKFKYAPVNADGLSVTVKISHFSMYSLVLNGSYNVLGLENKSYQIVGTSSSYKSEYQWQSDLAYQTTIPGDDATSVREIKIFLNQLVETNSRHEFSQISYNGLASENYTKSMLSFPPETPVGNPTEYSNLPARDWELVQQNCLVNVKIVVKIFDTAKNTYVDHVVNANYTTSTFKWVWRADDTYNISQAVGCGTDRFVIPVGEQHKGGSGN